LQIDKRVCTTTKYKSRKDPGDDLPIFNKVRCGERRNIHPWVHTSNLSKSVSKSLIVSVENVSGQFRLSLFKPFGLLMKFGLRSTQLRLKTSGPLFKPRNLGLRLLIGLFQLKDPNPQGQNTRLQCSNLLALGVE